MDTDHSDPDPVRRLTRLLTGLYKHGGIPYAADLITGPDGTALIDIVSPDLPGAGTLTDRAIRTHRMIVAAVAALGPPASQALTALLDLHPAARHARRPNLTLTERRHQAGTAFNPQLEGDTVRRHHERRLTIVLAFELYQRRRHDATTEPDPTPGRPYPPPPPPPEWFQSRSRATPPRYDPKQRQR
jgi:hypothetical protein